MVSSRSNIREKGFFSFDLIYGGTGVFSVLGGFCRLSRGIKATEFF
jgi:hypothetical protein